MRLPVAASWRWGSARRVFGLDAKAMANRCRGFCATGWFYRSRASARDSLDTYGVSEAKPVRYHHFWHPRRADSLPDSALMHGNMTFVHQSQALVHSWCHLFP